MNDAEVVRLLRGVIPELTAVYRFGSTAAGTAGPDSDIDLAFLAAAPLDPVRRFDVQEELAIALGHNIDLVDLRGASTVLRMQVLEHGLLLADLDRGERERYEDYVYSSYARLNEERRDIVTQVTREGSVHGR